MTKLFGTDGIRGKVGKYPLTEDAVFSIGRSLGLWLKQRYPQAKGALKILVGKDTRESGEELELALLKGATEEGLEILRVGICPTPAVAYLVCARGAHLGIAISASHNPGSDNGIKLFNSNGYKLFPPTEKEIEEIFFGLSRRKISPGLKLEDFPQDPHSAAGYIEFAKSVLNGLGLRGLKVVIDCAFGSFSKIAPEIFRQMGAKALAINDQPDGKNINVNCGTLYPEGVVKMILQEKADLGIVFDGDGDRVIVVDGKGRILDGDHMLAIFAHDLVKQNKLAQNTVVCTQMSNIGLELFLEKLGVRTIRTDVGDKYVLEKMLQEKANLGGEQSGHIILLEHSTTGDGLIAALQLIKVMLKKKQSLSEFARGLQKFPQVLLNVKMKEKRPFDEIPGLIEAIERSRTQLGKPGRILVRYSGTENLARIMIEGENLSLVKGLADSLAKIFDGSRKA